jgi:hypothetical protein
VEISIYVDRNVVAIVIISESSKPYTSKTPCVYLLCTPEQTHR